MNNHSIGIFDSGLGGLTVLQQINNILPNENLIYFGDTARVPYGNKSPNTIIKHSLSIVDFMISKKIKLLVVGCNTASAVALKTIQKHTNIPIIDVISPCVKEAVKLTKNKAIGIIGTQTTINSKAYDKQIIKETKNIKIYSQPCPLLVPLIEEGMFEHEITKLTVKFYLKTINKSTIDTLILGCTHYPLIKPLIKSYMKKNINIVDSSIITAKHIKSYLLQHNMNANTTKGKNEYFASDTHKNFIKTANLFLNNPINKLKQINL